MLNQSYKYGQRTKNLVKKAFTGDSNSDRNQENFLPHKFPALWYMYLQEVIHFVHAFCIYTLKGLPHCQRLVPHTTFLIWNQIYR